MQFPKSELIINPDKSIYHLNLLPGDVPPFVITVGDPNRVDLIGQKIDAIYKTVKNREFSALLGRLGDKDVLILSTGIGTDNIDIVLNELDALVNIDFATREEKTTKTKLFIIRLGTSGTLDDSIDLGSIVVSKYAIGLDNLGHFYGGELSPQTLELNQKILEFSATNGLHTSPYGCSSGQKLEAVFPAEWKRGITITAPGFYGPQGRQLRIPNRYPDLLDKLAGFSFHGVKTTNLEMETAGIYTMAERLGHEALSVNGILANRKLQTFASSPAEVVENMVDQSLEVIRWMQL